MRLEYLNTHKSKLRVFSKRPKKAVGEHCHETYFHAVIIMAIGNESVIVSNTSYLSAAFPKNNKLIIFALKNLFYKSLKWTLHTF